jgi:hypothetical protein
VAGNAEALEQWWGELTTAQQDLLKSGANTHMTPEIEQLVDRVPGVVRRVRGTFNGVPFPDQMPEPVRAFVREKRYGAGTKSS